MKNFGASLDDAGARTLTQSAVDGFWILLVFGLLFFNPFSVGPAGSRINLSLYDLLLPLIFLFEAMRGRIQWPNRSRVLLFLLPVVAIVFHSALVALLSENSYLAPLFIGTLRQAAFFLDIGMLLLLFQMPERRRPSQGVFLALLFMAAVYALMMRYLEYSVVGWETYETIYAAILTGLLLLFLFLLSEAKKSEFFIRALAASAWAAAVLFLIFAKLFIVLAVLLVLLFFFSELRKREGRRMGRFFFLVCISTALTAVFIAVLLKINLGANFSLIYGDLFSGIQHSIDVRVRIWSSAWGLIAQSFPWGVGLNQFSDQVLATTGAAFGGLRSIHNTPLRLLTELGALGIAIFGVVVALVVMSGRKLSGVWQAMLCLYLLTPMLFHDALGLRVFHVVLAFFLAKALFQTGPNRGDVHR